MINFSQRARIACLSIALGLGLCGCGGQNGRAVDLPVAASTPADTQIDRTPGETRIDSIRSIQRDVTYNLRIRLPNGYVPSQAYPIIYALDGDSNFRVMASLMDSLRIQAILVAVGRGDLRDRDYNQPGAYTYYKFLTLELIPYIEAKYKVLPDKRTLEGHSFGGMFVGIALFLDQQGNRYFSNFIAQEGTYDKDIWTTAAITELEQRVFDASGGKLPVTVVLSDSLQAFFLSSRGLHDKLKSRNYQGLTLKLMEYNLSHGDMFADSLTDSLRVIFP